VNVLLRRDRRAGADAGVGHDAGDLSGSLAQGALRTLGGGQLLQGTGNQG
jgi:hypothetical protein